MRIAVLVGVLLVLSGCVAPEPAATEDSQSPMDAPAPVQIALAEAVFNETGAPVPSPRLELEASGTAGSWIVVHAPFTQVVDEVSFEYDYEAVTDADQDGLGAFFWPLGTTQPEGQGWSVGRPNPFLNRLATFTASQQSWQQAGGMGVGSTQGVEGVFLALAAETAWTLRLEVELEDGTFAEPQVMQGQGAVFQHGGEALLPIPGMGPVNQATFDAEVPGSGWSHLEILRQRLQPDGASQVTLQLPTHEETELGVQQGYYAAGGSAGGGHLDYLGSLTDQAGAAHAEVTAARADLTVEFAFVHLPLGDLPGLRGSTYSGSTWPFDDLPTPP